MSSLLDLPSDLVVHLVLSEPSIFFPLTSSCVHFYKMKKKEKFSFLNESSTFWRDLLKRKTNLAFEQRSKKDLTTCSQAELEQLLNDEEEAEVFLCPYACALHRAAQLNCSFSLVLEILKRNPSLAFVRRSKDNLLPVELCARDNRPLRFLLEPRFSPQFASLSLDELATLEEQLHKVGVCVGAYSICSLDEAHNRKRLQSIGRVGD